LPTWSLTATSPSGSRSRGDDTEDLNLLVCSDLHGSEQAAELLVNAAQPEDYDLALICGDFTTSGSPEFARKLIKRIKVKVLAVPGNCDTPELVTVLKKAHASLHNESAVFGGWEFFGCGGGVPTSSGMPFEIEEKEIESTLRSVAKKGGVMVTHTPAYGMNDRGRSGNHGGSKAVLRIAQEFGPVLALAGHMHESRGKQVLGGTVFVNPGSLRSGLYASIWLGDEIKVKFHEDPNISGDRKTY
jgi:hypothetical protein